MQILNITVVLVWILLLLLLLKVASLQSNCSALLVVQFYFKRALFFLQDSICVRSYAEKL